MAKSSDHESKGRAHNRHTVEIILVEKGFGKGVIAVHIIRALLLGGGGVGAAKIVYDLFAQHTPK